jgi:hypothetical protein
MVVRSEVRLRTMQICTLRPAGKSARRVRRFQKADVEHVAANAAKLDAVAQFKDAAEDDYENARN